MGIEFEKLFQVIRDNDRQGFRDGVANLDAKDLEEKNSDEVFANWFTGIGATLLQLIALVRPDWATDLLQRGASIDLHSAAALGDVDIVTRRIIESPDALATTMDTFYPIQFALGQPSTLRTLLSHGDDANRSIQKLAWFEWEGEAVECGVSKWTLFHMVALGRGQRPHCESADLLLHFGAKIDSASSPFGDAPIHLSAIYDRVELLAWFVENGCNVDLATGAPCDRSIAMRLFDTEPFAPFLDAQQKTPLMLAAGEGQLRAVECLLRLGASVHARDHLGFTALHYASGAFWGEQIAIVERLVSAGADVELASKDGLRPRDLAEQRGYREVVAKLAG